ncbi:type IVB secretion system protein IcmH/DotU [Pseudomonas sp. Bout1]|uniref:type IVB secretion system protein IcmH/DotU n=1 Tax=Pseudomonas sp. Bout1 TaxID=3048600 RepID=UPI002AB3964B|nr:type IVB secretion system protein IcmH/DotU [Pseudomonas sp. Bout1]MDY7532543.1 type IVB secretion system protein IcmH/DotU [Pseudomonas sp. Bout1]MEB0188172.1 type IVB secretion system protein IcmH/DotU [Pseudomonas sp. Bout1]
MNDTFDGAQDPDRTLLIPTPGGRRPLPAASPVADVQSAALVLKGLGLNPLVRAANPLLDLVVPLRMLATPPDMESLRQRLIQAVQAFEAQARASQVDVETVAAARYALCTLVDETISSTPWGAGVWGSRSLLVTFHNEAWGGEKFFMILQRLSQDPRTHIHVLELMYLCMALGLEGRYRVLDRGLDQLGLLRERLLQLINQQRGNREQDLSPRWRGAEAPQASMLRRVPLWVLATVAAVLLLSVQLTYSWLLNRASDPVFAQLGAIRVASPLKVAAPATPAPVRLSGFLAPEVAQGLVTVKDSADRSVITLRGDGVFASGSAEVASNFDGLLNRIGDALATVPGDVVVVGHTDNVRPSATSRLGSNFDLSQARAKTVARLLGQRAGPAERYRSEGRGETEPLVPNDSPANRARNRRVDITVLIPSQAQ